MRTTLITSLNHPHPPSPRFGDLVSTKRVKQDVVVSCNMKYEILGNIYQLLLMHFHVMSLPIRRHSNTSQQLTAKAQSSGSLNSHVGIQQLLICPWSLVNRCEAGRAVRLQKRPSLIFTSEDVPCVSLPC